MKYHKQVSGTPRTNNVFYFRFFFFFNIFFMFFISFNARFSFPPLLSVDPSTTPDTSQPLDKYFNCGLFNSPNPSPYRVAPTVVVIVAVNARPCGRSVKDYELLSFASTNIIVIVILIYFRRMLKRYNNDFPFSH